MKLNYDIKTKGSQLQGMAAKVLAAGVANAGDFREALPFIFALRNKADSFKKLASELNDSADKIAEKCTRYAQEHEKALDVPLHELREGVVSGSITLDGITYTLTVSPDAIKRITGNSMTRKFIEGLPKEWTKEERKLSTDAINKLSVPPEELAKYDLGRPEKRVWSQSKENLTPCAE